MRPWRPTKDKARKAWKGSGEAATETVWFEVKEKAGATDFLGYETETAEGEIRAIVKDGKEVKSLKAGDEAALVLNQTPFYGESGGQVGDQGIIRGPKGAVFRVADTQKRLGDLLVHFGRVEKGSFKGGDAVALEVDHSRRTATRANHSATHLLHEALRQILGTHVAQKGSLVAPDRLRFDFSHPKPMSAEELAAVEDMANAYIVQNTPVTTRLMAIEDAHGDAAPWPSSARSTARRCASSPWGCRRDPAVPIGKAQQVGLVGGAVRRHPCEPHRRHRPRQGRCRKCELAPACGASRR